MCGHVGIDRELPDDPSFPGRAHTVAPLRIISQFRNRVSHCRHVLGIHEHAGRALDNQLGQAGRSGGDHRQPRGHRLRRRQGQPFPAAGLDEYVGGYGLVYNDPDEKQDPMGYGFIVGVHERVSDRLLKVSVEFDDQDSTREVTIDIDDFDLE